MLRLRLKKAGRKKQPSFRLVVIESRSRRDGRPIDEVGYYNPITKQSHFETNKITKWIKVGVKPSRTVENLLKKAGLVIKV